MEDDHQCEVCRELESHQAADHPEPHSDPQAPDTPMHKVLKVVRNENQLVAALQQTQDRIADIITAFAGSMRFVYLHTLWFAVWVAINAGLFGSSLIFDGFPFGLLTLIVSLEAIFLSTFVMLSQNRQAARADLRAELDYETNIRSEIWSLHIGQKLGVDADHVEHAVARLITEARKET